MSNRLMDLVQQESENVSPDSNEQEESSSEIVEDTVSEWSKNEDEETPKETAPQPEEGEYVVADGKKIKIDFSNKEAIKKAHQEAAGMRKFQRERDKERQLSQELRKELDEVKSLWGKIEKAAGKNDYNELMRIMTGGKTDFDSLLQAKLERAKLRAEATDEERVKLDQEDKIADMEAKLSKQSEEIEKLLGNVAKERETASVKEIQSRINPVFEKVRFAGKLDDPDLEHEYDSMLWLRALARLDEYEEADRTPEIISKEFSHVAELLNRGIEKLATKETKKVVDERRKIAKETAQIQQKKGYVSNNLKQEAAEKIRRGDLSGILSNWKKFGNLFD